MLRGLGNVAKLMGSMGEIQSRMEAMKASLSELKVEGAAGGGMVTVIATGSHRVTRVTIEQSLMEAGDREMIEELVAAATNQALEKAKQAAAEEMSKMAGDLEIPGIGDALARFGLGGLDGTQTGE
jgi:nucleoid-associated protein EbfC